MQIVYEKNRHQCIAADYAKRVVKVTFILLQAELSYNKTLTGIEILF